MAHQIPARAGISHHVVARLLAVLLFSASTGVVSMQQKKVEVRMDTYGLDLLHKSAPLLGMLRIPIHDTTGLFKWLEESLK